MHKELAALGGRVDAIFYCPHTPDDDCHCRKPAPGLLEQIGERYGIDLKSVPVVGDALRDVLAGAAAGCQPHLVLTGNGSIYQSIDLPPTFPQNTRVHQDLSAFADWLVTRDTPVPTGSASD